MFTKSMHLCSSRIHHGSIIIIIALCIVHNLKGYEDINFDGTQFISSALIATPLHRQTNELGITFRTTRASCLLFFASGVKGDYIALELWRGKIRFVANSDGMSSFNSPALDIIHGNADVNYADGEYHQVNVEIGLYTRIYTYTFPHGESGATVANSTAKDLRFDLDEISYFMGVPNSAKSRTANILKSQKNFRGCLSSITFNEQKINMDPVFFQRTKRVSFHGQFSHNCTIHPPKFLQSFTRSQEKLSIFSHVNRDKFRIKFQYRTYSQSGIIVRSVSADVNSTALILEVVKNNLVLKVNVSQLPMIQFEHWDKHGDDGTWKDIYVEINSQGVTFIVDEHKYTYTFPRQIQEKYPNEITFGGNFREHIGFIGCVKDIYTGKNLVLVNKILGLSDKTKYSEKMCRIKDLCFSENPCRNRGKCIQNYNEVKCNCSGTGFSGDHCEVKSESKFLKSCGEYFHEGYRRNGYYFIKPGNSLPFKVRCEMNTTQGAVTVLERATTNKTHVFTGADHDKDYYYYPIYYRASKIQIEELISHSVHCEQLIHYNCYHSTLLNTKSRAPRTEFGVRWYSRDGFKQPGWHSNLVGKRLCACGENNSCVKKGLVCNCDGMERKWRTDDGKITDRNLLPVSKMRVSTTLTNHRSFFHVGSLRCRSRNLIDNHVEQQKPLNNVLLNHVRNIQIFENVSYTVGFKNKTQLETDKNPAEELVVIDRRLLYLIIAVVVLFTILLLCLLVFKRYIPCICCKLYNNQAKPQIIEIYKDEYFDDRHKDYVDESFEYDVGEFAREMEFHNNSNSSSLSTVDAGRYFSPHESDDDHSSLISSRSTNSIPTKSILKIKKELPPPTLTKQQKQQQIIIRQLQEKASRGTKQSSPSFQKETESDQNKNNIDNKVDSIYSIADNFLPNFDETPSPPTRKCYSQDSKNSKESLNRFRNQDVGNFPLKQKILELSTNQSLETNRDNRQSSTSSASLASSKGSSGDDETSEATPLERLKRSKSVRFSDGDDVTSNLLRNNSKTKEFLEESIHFLHDERNRTQTFC